jgi:hypothetical protein
MHDHFKFQKVCAMWLLRELKDREKIIQMCLILQHLLCYADDEDMLNRTVTGDESWAHHYEPESKCVSTQWKHPSSPSTKKFKVMSMPSAGRVQDSQGVLLAHFQKRGENVNSALYCEVLLKIQDVIFRKHPGQLVRGVVLHHDYAIAHAAQAIQDIIQELQWELLKHLPHSQDLAHSVFHLFGLLQNLPGGRCFTDDKKVET